MPLLLNLFLTFFKIGLFTFGGGYAMVPLVTDSAVSSGWVTKNELLDYIAVASSTPGPFGVNVATFIGMKEYGVIGAVAAVLGLVMPSVIIILIIAKFLMKFIEYRGVKAAFTGLSPAVIGLMAASVISMAISAFSIKFAPDFYKNINFIEIFIFIIVFALSKIKKLKLDSYKIIIVSAVLGILFYALKDYVKL